MTGSEENYQPTFGLHEVEVHDAHEHVAAVFGDRPTAIAAVDDLRNAGLGSEHLGIAVRGDEDIDFEHDADVELVDDIENGVKIGAPIGALAGLTLAAAALPGTVLGVGGVLAIGGVSALWGALLGGYVGAGVGSSAWDAHQQLLLTALDEGQVLVVVCDHGRRAEIERIFELRGGRLLPLAGSTA